MAISKLGQRRQVVIPKAIWEDLALEIGDFVEVERVERTVVIKPKKLVDAEDVLTFEEEDLVRRGDEEIRRGEYITLEYIRLAKEAARQLEKAPRDYHALLLKKLRDIAEDPFCGDVVLLKGKEWKSYYRKRVGRNRIVFRLHQSDRIVDVVAILARDENR